MPKAKTRNFKILNNRKKQAREFAFTACAAGVSLLKTMTDAAKIRGRLSAFLLSTARSSFDEFQNARNSGQNLYLVFESISWGQRQLNPNISGQSTAASDRQMPYPGTFNFSFRAFLREKHGANHPITQSSLQKGRQARQSNE